MENLSQISRADSDEYNEDPYRSKPLQPVPEAQDLRPKFAVKIIRSRDEEYQSVALKEYYLLKQLNHPGVIKMKDAFINKSSQSIYLVMDLVEGESLESFIRNRRCGVLAQETETKNTLGEGGLPEEESKQIIRQLIEIIKYLH